MTQTTEEFIDQGFIKVPDDKDPSGYHLYMVLDEDKLARKLDTVERALVEEFIHNLEWVQECYGVNGNISSVDHLITQWKQRMEGK